MNIEKLQNVATTFVNAYLKAKCLRWWKSPIPERIKNIFPDTFYREPLHDECPQYHRHKRNPGVTLEICDVIGKRVQMFLV